MKHVIDLGIHIYGETYLTINVYTLLHLVDNYKKWGPLDNSSAFIFESYLGSMKRLVRSGKEPLKQVVARLHEASTVHKPKLVQQENDIPLYTKPPGNVYISLEEKIPVIHEKLSGNSFEVILFDQTSDFFTKPFPSRVMFNYLVNGRGRRKVMSIEEVKELKLIRALMFKSHG
ncbi:uncharacterized protein LOC111715909 [Eurytemora carolleeae]|uniref:uncharacterized protein LOC111715909 n=1 Tax=Eurytemora carolleeae TaxID=1294199 RepID=UPI000C7806ED|nr:uncharacterized protein LOC111715909 [Eurytemora carolleeae]|eukprot:XP_023347075.1 uncharacterized protein LOC111715909 [Eurytemora affinis]